MSVSVTEQFRPPVVENSVVHLPEWLLLSGVSAQALKLYAFLAGVPGSTDPPGVTVAQAILAQALGLANQSQVKQYVDQLREVGALVTEIMRYAGNMRRCTVYRLIPHRPESYNGPMTVARFLANIPEARRP